MSRVELFSDAVKRRASSVIDDLRELASMDPRAAHSIRTALVDELRSMMPPLSMTELALTEVA